MAANPSQASPVSSAQVSTLQTRASASAANEAAVPSSRGTPAASSVAVTSSLSNPVITGPAMVAASWSGVVPSVIVTDPGTPTGQAQIQDTQDSPFDINTYQLMKSIGIPVVVARTVEPTIGV